jgi:hypothetical protein
MLFTVLFTYGLPILFIYLSYRYIWRGAKVSILPLGWGNLSDYRTASLPAGGHSIDMRIGSQTYTMQQIRLLVAPEGLYLQRQLLGGSPDTLCIPYAHLRLDSTPTTKRIFFARIPVYGIFYVGGVDLWIDDPAATAIIQHLRA